MKIMSEYKGKNTQVLCALALMLFLMGLWAGSACAAQPSADVLRKEIRILDRARRSVAAELENGSAGRHSSQDYKRYMDYLDSRITALCAQAFSTGGLAAVADLPCPPPDSLLPGYQTPASESYDNRVRAIDQELLESLGNFDEFLAAEQRRVSNKRPEAAGSAPSEPGGTAGSTGQAGGGAGARGQGGTTGSAMGSGSMNGGGYQQAGSERGQQPGTQGGAYPGASQQGAMPQGTGAGMPGAQGERGPGSQQGTGTGQGRTAEGSSQGKQPGTVAGGRAGVTGQEGSNTIYADDDIVARQLREAAEKEKDPALKKKLWEEYRKYKEGNR